MFPALFQHVAQVSNCSDGVFTATKNCLTTLPQVDAGPGSVKTILTIVFGVLGSISVIIIILQAIKFAVSNGDTQKAADARRGIIYSLVGLAVSLSAEIIVRVVINKL